jgi:hypothetical protein
MNSRSKFPVPGHEAPTRVIVTRPLERIYPHESRNSGMQAYLDICCRLTVRLFDR